MIATAFHDRRKWLAYAVGHPGYRDRPPSATVYVAGRAFGIGAGRRKLKRNASVVGFSAVAFGRLWMAVLFHRGNCASV